MRSEAARCAGVPPQARRIACRVMNMGIALCISAGGTTRNGFSDAERRHITSRISRAFRVGRSRPAFTGTLWTTVSGFESLPPSHSLAHARSRLLGTSCGKHRDVLRTSRMVPNPCLPVSTLRGPEPQLPQPGFGSCVPSLKCQYSRRLWHRPSASNVRMNAPASVTGAPSLTSVVHHSTAVRVPTVIGMP